MYSSTGQVENADFWRIEDFPSMASSSGASVAAQIASAICGTSQGSRTTEDTGSTGSTDSSGEWSR